jgi:hypothetical protein
LPHGRSFLRLIEKARAGSSGAGLFDLKDDRRPRPNGRRSRLPGYASGTIRLRRRQNFFGFVPQIAPQKFFGTAPYKSQDRMEKYPRNHSSVCAESAVQRLE